MSSQLVADDLIAPPPPGQAPSSLISLIDKAGNTLATARNIGTLTSSQTFSDWVGSSDVYDYYRFDLAQASSFALSLTGLSADADVQLLNNSGGQMAISEAGGITAESIKRSLAAGTYYVRVYPYIGNTTYNLSLAATPTAPPDNAGNTLAAARNIGSLTSSQTFSDWVGSADTNDYYRFDLVQASSFALTLTGLSADADVQLLNSSGGQMAISEAGGSTAESISRSLDAGTYYVRVYPYIGNTTYNLSLAATPTAPPDLAGNTLRSARDIGSLTTSQTFYEWVGSAADSNDYYRFDLAQTSSFSLTLHGLSADCGVLLLNNNGAQLAFSDAGGSMAEAINSILAAGTYYVSVYSNGGDNPYNLTLAATPTTLPDNAGNTLATARNVGTLTGSQTFSDWLGSTDSNDYYRFDLAQASSFALFLTGLSSGADVQLLNNSGVEVASSESTGSTETIISSLTAGTYYVWVYSYGGDSTYNLTLTGTPSGNWFEQNLSDAGLITLGSSLAADGNFSRNDMISLFRDAKDGDLIDANELTDLRTILANSGRFTMGEPVRVLANKIANGDAANTRAGFGNLAAGSTANQLENLIGKWFLGNDRPDLTSTSYTYRYASGSLFQGGASADDIDQNALGDCYYLSTLSSIALEQPSYLQNMFIDNGDDTFTVRFFNNSVADYLTVDRYLPTNSSGYAVYAGWGAGSSTSTSNELWVALAEKAYAQLAESGWSRTYSGTQVNAYAAIEGGWMDVVIRQVMGVAASSQSVTTMTQNQLINLVNSNQVLTAGFVYGAGYGVVDGHAYTVTAYNSANGTFHLRNPWGTSHADVTWDQLLSLRAVMQWSNA